MNKDVRRLMAKHAFREARALLSAELDKNPDDWSARLRYGICSLMLGETRVFLEIQKKAEAVFGRRRPGDFELARLLARYAALAATVAALAVALPGCKKDDDDDMRVYVEQGNSRVVALKYGVIEIPPIMKYAVWPGPEEPIYTPKYGVITRPLVPVSPEPVDP